MRRMGPFHDLRLIQASHNHTLQELQGAEAAHGHVQVAVDPELARCPAAATPHPSTVRLRLDHLLARSYVPAPRPEGCLQLQGLVLDLHDSAEAEARMQPCLLGRSEHSAAVSSILPDTPPPQPDRPLLRLHSLAVDLASQTAEPPSSAPPEAGHETDQQNGSAQHSPAQDQGSCQVSSSSLAVHLYADALLGLLSVAAAAKGAAQRLKQHLEPHTRAEAAQAAVHTLEAAAEQGNTLPAAAATAAVAVAEQQGGPVSEPGKPASKLRALAASTVLTARVLDSCLELRMADDVTWALTLDSLSTSLSLGQFPSAGLQGLAVHLNNVALLTAHSMDAAALHIAHDVYPRAIVQHVSGAFAESPCMPVTCSERCTSAAGQRS